MNEDSIHYTMDEKETLKLTLKILNYLKYGHENAVQLKELKRKLFLRDDRKIRLAIRELRKSCPIAIASKKPYGYFIIATPEEYEEFRNYIISRIDEERQMLEDVEASAKSRFDKAYQPPMFFS